MGEYRRAQRGLDLLCRQVCSLGLEEHGCQTAALTFLREAGELPRVPSCPNYPKLPWTEPLRFLSFSLDLLAGMRSGRLSGPV